MVYLPMKLKKLRVTYIINFRVNLPISAKKNGWDCDRDHIGYVHQFEGITILTNLPIHEHFPLT